MGAALNVGLIPSTLIVGHQDMVVIDAQPQAVPAGIGRAATVAGSAAWPPVADDQARAKHAAS